MPYKNSGIAIIKGVEGNTLSYTMCQYDDEGNLIKSNIRKSYPVKATDTDIITAIDTLTTFIENMENQ